MDGMTHVGSSGCLPPFQCAPPKGTGSQPRTYAPALAPSSLKRRTCRPLAGRRMPAARCEGPTLTSTQRHTSPHCPPVLHCTAACCGDTAGCWVRATKRHPTLPHMRATSPSPALPWAALRQRRSFGDLHSAAKSVALRPSPAAGHARLRNPTITYSGPTPAPRPQPACAVSPGCPPLSCARSSSILRSASCTTTSTLQGE